METLISAIIESLSLGAMYAVIALGVALIVGVARVMNFAHGDLIMVAGYAVVLTAGTSWVLAVVIAIVAVVLIALAMELLVFRWARKSDATTLLIIAFALSQFIQNLMFLTVGPTPYSTSFGLELSEQVRWGEIGVPKLTLVTLGAAGLLLGLMTLLLTRSRFGLELRAASEDFTMARMMGVRANRVIPGAFILSGLSAGAGGVLLIAQAGSITPLFGVQPVLVAFVAMIIGGLGSLPGAAVGGLILGTITTFFQAYLPSELAGYRDSLVFVLVIVLLLFRPWGIFKGTQIGERV